MTKELHKLNHILQKELLQDNIEHIPNRVNLEELYHDNRYHGKAVTMRLNVFPGDKTEITHAYGDLYLLGASEQYQSAEDYYLSNQYNYDFQKPIYFMIPKDYRTNSFSTSIENNQFKIQLIDENGEMLKSNSPALITFLVRYIGKWDPEDGTLSLKPKDVEDCFFHLYLIKVSS
ncbi:MAG: hypothetical protein MRY83_04905 [Flavobacteriales bacterium]|nr:hypothetical protein [Flavobacteriales bacterium]